jgi:hypothetical protein
MSVLHDPSRMAGRGGNPRLNMGRLLQTTGLALVAAVCGNVVVGWLLGATLAISSEFPPFQVGPIALLTGIGTLGAAIVFAVVQSVSRQPLRTFRAVAIGALIVSLIPNLLLAFNPTAAPIPGGTATGYIALMILHVVAAAIVLVVVERSYRVNTSQRG